MNDEKLLRSLHAVLTEELLARIKSGEATASDLSVARQFLKDNGIDSVPKKGSPLDQLAGSLPFTENEEEEAASLPN